MPAAMPGVARRMAELRHEYGDAHVERCWSEGMAGQPGFFFAREGPAAIGTPWDDDPVMANFAAACITPTQAVVVMRKPGAGDGAR